VNLVTTLPSRLAASTMRNDLPVSAIGRIPGSGAVVEIAENEAFLEGVRVGGALSERVTKFREWMRDGAAKTPLYVAAARNTDVQTLRAYLTNVPEGVDIRLLVRAPNSAFTPDKGEESAEARELGARLIREGDGATLREALSSGYRDFSRCDALDRAVSSVASLDGHRRWPALKDALAQSLPGCRCSDLDAPSLELLVSAEQRAGSGAVAWVPLTYLKDERCGASMPLRSVEKLVQQLEQFDAEFSADFSNDAVTFSEVLVGERLRVFFCDALPGETVSAIANARSTLYLPTGNRSCDAWSFAPMSLGSPMGTVSRAAHDGRAALSFHYWQAAEDIRWFGPVETAPPSKPTDEHDWACEETLHLTGIDEHSIQLRDLRWFYDRPSCERAAAGVYGLSGCAASRAAGSTPAAEPSK
jgi:hypothetical protein